MKRLLPFFGVLDVLTIIRSLTIKMHFAGLWADTQVLLLMIGQWTLYASLGISAYFLIRQRRIGLWITYGQFPLRVFYVVFSFGFILSITDFFGGFGRSNQILIWIIFGLEVARLIVTARVHRKYFRSE